MDFIFKFFQELYVQQPELVFMLAQIFLTYNVLKFVFKSPTTKQKIGSTWICGAVLGVCWYLFVDGVELFKLIFAYLAAPTFYDWVIKWLEKKKVMKYNNNKGLV